jgi:hypothetical protein
LESVSQETRERRRIFSEKGNEELMTNQEGIRE